MLRIVPWSNREEWIETYENLYDSNNIEHQLEALKRVETWQSRSGNKLPLAIEVTASLISATVEDLRSCLSQYALRHLMSMAVVRFVNGMVDMEQKGAYARSVQSIGDEIGLPDWLVDLRHEATHASLPSLQVLRSGCRFALNWLKDCYWEAQIAEFCERDESLLQLVTKYANLYEVGEGKKNSRKAIANDIANLVSKANMWESLLDVSFGKDELLIPSHSTLEEIFSAPSIERSKDSLQLPLAVQQWITPLLKALHKTNDKFLTDLVVYLLKEVHAFEGRSRYDMRALFYSSLINFILMNCSRLNNEKKQWKFKAELDYLVLLDVCMRNPSKNNHYFLPLITENLQQLSKKLRDKLYKFSTIQVASVRNENSSKPLENQNINLETFKKDFPLVAKAIEAKLKESEQVSSTWKKCPSSFGDTYKFGAFIGDKSREIAQNKDLNETYDNQTNSESMEVDLNEELDTSCVSEESNDVEINILTEEMVKDINENVWIF